MNFTTSIVVVKTSVVDWRACQRSHICRRLIVCIEIKLKLRLTYNYIYRYLCICKLVYELSDANERKIIRVYLRHTKVLHDKQMRKPCTMVTCATTMSLIQNTSRYAAVSQTKTEFVHFIKLSFVIDLLDSRYLAQVCDTWKEAAELQFWQWRRL